MTIEDLNTLATAIRTSPNLQALCLTLNVLRDAFKAYNDDFERDAAHDVWHDIGWQDVGIDLTELPTFGGSVPGDTAGIWSWDAGHLLLDDAQSRFVIEAR